MDRCSQTKAYPINLKQNYQPKFICLEIDRNGETEDSKGVAQSDVDVVAELFSGPQHVKHRFVHQCLTAI